MIPLILFSALLVLLLLNIPVPVAVTLAGAAAMLVMGNADLQVVVQRTYYGLNTYVFVAIPLFILLGQLMMAAKLTERLIDFALVLVGHVRGGLAHVSVVASAVMSSISGSSVADAAATGAVLGPAMVKQGYSNGFAAAAIGAASAGAALIPPSIPMIIYASLANVSVGKVFIAGIVPGLFIAAGLATMIAIQARRQGLPAGPRATRAETFTATRRAALVLLAPLIVIVGVVGGIFTPTEAGGVAVAYAFLLTLLYRAVSPGMLYGVFTSTVRISAQLMLTIASASIFAWILARARVPEMVASLPLFHGEFGPVILLLAINLIVFILGLVMEGTAILVIITPIFLPVVLAAGIDPVHLGVVLAINLALGGITPPFGVLMFVLCSVTPATIVQFARNILPFLLLLIALMMVITFVPQLSLMLPELLM